MRAQTGGYMGYTVTSQHLLIKKYVDKGVSRVGRVTRSVTGERPDGFTQGLGGGRLTNRDKYSVGFAGAVAGARRGASFGGWGVLWAKMLSGGGAACKTPRIWLCRRRVRAG